MTASMAAAHEPATSGPRRVRTVVLPRRFDAREVPQFKSAIDRMVTAGPVVVIDASQVRYVDRSAMDSLAEARLRCMDHGGDLTLVANSGYVSLASHIRQTANGKECVCGHPDLSKSDAA